MPKIGIFPAKCLMASTEIPASSGRPGPGETINLEALRPQYLLLNTLYYVILQ